MFTDSLTVGDVSQLQLNGLTAKAAKPNKTNTRLQPSQLIRGDFWVFIRLAVLIYPHGRRAADSYRHDDKVDDRDHREQSD